MSTEVRQTAAYQKRFTSLKDREARARVLARIRRLSLGNPGDVKPVGEGVVCNAHRLRPWLPRLLHTAGSNTVILLAGGDKGSQTRDIQAARRLARELRSDE